MWYLYLSEPPFSHFETVCLTTLSLTASSSWERPFDLLKVFMLSFNIPDTFFLSVVTAIIMGRYARCRKQLKLTSHQIQYLGCQRPEYQIYHVAYDTACHIGYQIGHISPAEIVYQRLKYFYGEAQ